MSARSVGISPKIETAGAQSVGRALDIKQLSKRGGDAMKFIPHDYQKYAISKILAESSSGLFLDMGL